jgi:hypothetical protein
MTAADVANGNMFVANGNDLMVIHNTAGSDYTFTVTSTVDAYGRTKDITTETIAAGATRLWVRYSSRAGYRLTAKSTARRPTPRSSSVSSRCRCDGERQIIEKGLHNDIR